MIYVTGKEIDCLRKTYNRNELKLKTREDSLRLIFLMRDKVPPVADVVEADSLDSAACKSKENTGPSWQPH
jgi:hypothetical protein